MNTSKKMLFFVSVVAVVTAGLMLYYSEDNKESKDEQQVIIHEENIAKSPADDDAPEYVVCLEDSTVILYSITDGIRTQIDSVEIDTSYYPGEDIKSLTSGIPAYNIDEGFRILENFAN